MYMDISIEELLATTVEEIQYETSEKKKCGDRPSMYNKDNSLFCCDCHPHGCPGLNGAHLIVTSEMVERCHEILGLPRSRINLVI